MQKQNDGGATTLAAETARYLGASAHYVNASRRDPRQHHFGYVAADPSTGARGPFLWFASPQEMFDFLCTVEVALLQFDEATSTRMSTSLRRALAAVRGLARVDVAELTAAFEGWNEILWMGTIHDLCERGSPLAREARVAFRQESGRAAHALPIAGEEMDGFVRWVTDFHEPATNG
jgi:hypothetical protein